MNEQLIQDYIYDLAVSTDDVYFSARSTGLFRSDDGGNTWHNALATFDASTTYAVTAIATVPDQNTIFCGVMGAVLRSDDGGQSWQAFTLASPPPVIAVLAVSPNFARDYTVVAGTLEDGMFISHDRGRSWTAWNFGLIGFSVNALALSPDFADNNIIVAGTELGVFISTNRGRSWRDIPLQSEPEPVIALAFSARFAHDGLIWVGTEQGLWQLTLSSGDTRLIQHNAVTGSIDTIIVTQNPSSTTLIALCDSQIVVSTDNGLSWKPVELNDEPIVTLTKAGSQEASICLLVGLADGRTRFVTLPTSRGE